METKEIKTRVKVCSLEEFRGGRPPSCGEGEGDDACELRALFPVPRRAVILLANGEIVGGANQENAAFSSGDVRRAERVLLCRRALSGRGFQEDRRGRLDPAPASGFGLRRRLFPGIAHQPVRRVPPGALEYENAHGPIEVILYGAGKTYVLPSVASLLPLCFTEF